MVPKPKPCPECHHFLCGANDYCMTCNKEWRKIEAARREQDRKRRRQAAQQAGGGDAE
jgi:hypothetical protein